MASAAMARNRGPEKNEGLEAPVPKTSAVDKGKGKADARSVFTLDSALEEIAGGGEAEVGPSEHSCAVCFCDYAPGQVVLCSNPRKQHAICKDCFLQWFATRGNGPFTGLTIAQASQPMCVHANKQSGADECLCSDEPGDYSRSFYPWREVTNKKWMTKTSVDKWRDEARARQLTFADDALVGETLLYIVPIANRFLELREAHEARLASSSGGGVKKKAKNKVEGFEWHGSYQKDFRRQLRVHSHVLFTPLPSIMRDVAAGIDCEDEGFGGQFVGARAGEGRGGAAAQAPPAPARLLPCLGDGCSNGRWEAEAGGCLICKLPHCVKCGQLTGEDAGGAAASGAGGSGSGRGSAAAAAAAPADPESDAAAHKAKGKGKAATEKGKAAKGKGKSGHVCDQEAVKTHTTILRNTQTCPKCGAAIMKSSGCDQMFCTLCNTAFSYRTGKVETGIVHNPYFFALPQHLQQQIRQRNAGGEAEGGGGGCVDNGPINARQYHSFVQLLQRLRGMALATPDQCTSLAAAFDYLGHFDNEAREYLRKSWDERKEDASAGDRNTLTNRNFELEGRKSRLAMLMKAHLPERSKQLPSRQFPPDKKVLLERAATLAKPLKEVTAAARVRDAKTRDTLHANIQLSYELGRDYAAATRVLALSAIDPATPTDGALRALALMLRNWGRLLEEAPRSGGGGVSVHAWVKRRTEERERAVQWGWFNADSDDEEDYMPEIHYRRWGFGYNGVFDSDDDDVSGDEMAAPIAMGGAIPVPQELGAETAGAPGGAGGGAAGGGSALPPAGAQLREQLLATEDWGSGSDSDERPAPVVVARGGGASGSGAAAKAIAGPPTAAAAAPAVPVAGAKRGRAEADSRPAAPVAAAKTGPVAAKGGAAPSSGKKAEGKAKAATHPHKQAPTMNDEESDEEDAALRPVQLRTLRSSSGAAAAAEGPASPVRSRKVTTGGGKKSTGSGEEPQAKKRRRGA